MVQMMTLAEIQTRFDTEWVLIENPEVTEALELIGGTVLWHSKDRDEVYRKAQELGPQHSAIWYMGTLPDEVIVVL